MRIDKATRSSHAEDSRNINDGEVVLLSVVVSIARQRRAQNEAYLRSVDLNLQNILAECTRKFGNIHFAGFHTDAHGTIRL